MAKKSRTEAGPSVALVRELIDAGLLATCPIEAWEKVRAASGGALRRDGLGSAPIARLRAGVAAAESGRALQHDLMIAAPHTHWDEAPIICSYDRASNSYVVGPNEYDEGFRPVSFVFGPDGPIPYEWIDASVNVDLARYEQLIARVEALAVSHGADAASASLGLAINYRFRPLGALIAFSTFEQRVEDGMPARIILDDLGEARLDRSAGQVAWGALSPEDSALDVRVDVVQELEMALREVPPDEGARLLEGLADWNARSTS